VQLGAQFLQHSATTNLMDVLDLISTCFAVHLWLYQGRNC